MTDLFPNTPCWRSRPTGSCAGAGIKAGAASIVSTIASWKAPNSDLSIAMAIGGLGYLTLPVKARKTAILPHNLLFVSEPKSVEMQMAIGVPHSFQNEALKLAFDRGVPAMAERISQQRIDPIINDIHDF